MELNTLQKKYIYLMFNFRKCIAYNYDHHEMNVTCGKGE